MDTDERYEHPRVTNGIALFKADKMVAFIPDDRKTVDFMDYGSKVTVDSDLVRYVQGKLNEAKEE